MSWKETPVALFYFSLPLIQFPYKIPPVEDTSQVFWWVWGWPGREKEKLELRCWSVGVGRENHWNAGRPHARWLP